MRISIWFAARHISSPPASIVGEGSSRRAGRGSRNPWAAPSPSSARWRVDREAKCSKARRKTSKEAAIMRPQHATRELAAEPRAAAFVRHRKAPAAHAMLPPNHRLADAPGSHNNDTAVLAAMGARAGRVRVGRKDSPPNGCLWLSRAKSVAGSLAPAIARHATIADSPGEKPASEKSPPWLQAPPPSPPLCRSVCLRVPLRLHQEFRRKARTGARGTLCRRHPRPEEGTRFAPTSSGFDAYLRASAGESRRRARLFEFNEY